MYQSNLVDAILKFVTYAAISRFPIFKKNNRRINTKRNIIFHDFESPHTYDAPTCIIFIAHKGVWHESAWTEWNKDNQVRFFVHQDKKERDFPSSVPNFGTPIPHPKTTRRGELSVVEAILHSLDFVRRNHTDIRRFFILTGDCIPIQKIENFLALLPSKSVISFHKREDDDQEFVVHNIEMMLCKDDVEILCQHLLPKLSNYEPQNQKVKAYNEALSKNESMSSNDLRQLHMMDEFVIGDFLFSINKQSDFAINQTIAGWIAVDSPDDTLKAITIENKDQEVQVDEVSKIISPHPHNGELHVTIKENNETLKMKELVTHLFATDEFNEFLVFRKISPKFKELLKFILETNR